jgi:hypothetical protein
MLAAALFLHANKSANFFLISIQGLENQPPKSFSDMKSKVTFPIPTTRQLTEHS